VTQLGLFEAKARARRTDPQTSHVAAKNVERSGGAKDQRSKCLEIVKGNPNLTAAEIAVKAGMERHVPSRRLPELREMGLVVNGKARKCRAVGSVSMTWAAV